MIRTFLAILIGLSPTMPARAADPSRLGLLVIEVAEGKVEQVASEPLPGHRYCGSPDWSFDGQRIVFDATPGKEFSKTHIAATDFPGTEQRKFVDLGAGNCPTWSPHARRIAFRLNPGALADAAPGIWIMNADGKERRRLADGGLPKWSPDGKKVLSITFSNPCELSLIDAKSGDSQPIELADHQFYSVPSWAGDGQTLIAVVKGKGALMVALVDVSDPSKAKFKEVVWTRGTGLSDEPIYPVYSAEAKRCVFVGRSPLGFFLYRIDADTKGVPLKLEPNSLGERIAGLAITGDGKRVLFCSEREAKRRPNEPPADAERM